jgi:hypothetical protein
VETIIELATAGSHEWEILAEVAVAMLLGGVVGLEREAAHKPAGFHAHARGRRRRAAGGHRFFSGQHVDAVDVDGIGDGGSHSCRRRLSASAFSEAERSFAVGTETRCTA